MRQTETSAKRGGSRKNKWKRKFWSTGNGIRDTRDSVTQMYLPNMALEERSLIELLKEVRPHLEEKEICVPRKQGCLSDTL